MSGRESSKALGGWVLSHVSRAVWNAFFTRTRGAIELLLQFLLGIFFTSIPTLSLVFFLVKPSLLQMLLHLVLRITLADYTQLENFWKGKVLRTFTHAHIFCKNGAIMQAFPQEVLCMYLPLGREKHPPTVLTIKWTLRVRFKHWTLLIP